jgi:hypothetical protein
MKMKLYNYLLSMTFAVLAVCLSGCNEDGFLKEVTETSYTYSNMFTVSSQVNDCVTELYQRHKPLMYPNGNNSWFLNGNGTDVSDASKSTNTAAQGISNFINWTTTYGQTQTVFNGFYQLIARANLVIAGAEQVTWANENDKYQAIAQARFFRGYSYMNLAELFGGVPISENFSETPKFDFLRASREDTYLYAITELEAAAAVLPEHSEAGRAGKGVAWHYLAETWLALAVDQNNDATYLDKSINAANEVMKYHSLMKTRFGTRANPALTGSHNGVADYFSDGDVFFDLFQRGNLDYEEGNTESLWVDQNDIRFHEAYNISSANLNFPQAFGPVFRNVYWKSEWIESGAGGGPWTGGGIGNDEFNLNGNISAYIGGRGQARIEPTVYAKNTVWNNCGSDMRNSPVNIRRSFKVMDPKHSLYGLELNADNIADYITEATLMYFYPIHTKVVPFDDWGYDGLISGKNNRANIYSDFYFARLAETYLLRAEAKLRKGDRAGAAADINEIRGRAQAPLVEAAAVDLDYILDERIRELYGEERRWNTLLRMGGAIPNDRIIQHAYWIADNPTWSGSLGTDFLFPIPQSVIDSNLDAVIEQNPGWK